MKWLKQRWHNSKLWIRMALPMGIVLVTMLGVFHWALYRYATKTVNDTLSDSVESTLIRAQSYIDVRLKNIMERMLFLRLDTSVETMLSNFLLSEEAEADAVTQSKMVRALSMYRASESLSSSALLYTPKGSFQAGGFSLENDFDFSKSALEEELHQQPGPMIFAPAQRDEAFISHRMVIPGMYRFQIAGSSQDCVLVINVDQAKFTEFVRKILPGDGSDICIVDRNGEFVMSANSPACQELVLQSKSNIEQVLAAEKPVLLELSGETYLVGCCALDCAPWTVFYLQSTRQTSEELHEMRSSFAVITAIVLLVLMAAVMRIAGTVTAPLKAFCRHIQTSTNDSKLSQFHYAYQDEVGMLAQTYNSMLVQIHTLLDSQQAYIAQLQEEKERADMEQKLKRRAELQALQAQINPHFLYNTLDSIHWKAEKIDAHDIAKMTTSLATLFRISLSRGQEIISIEQEARHALSYLQIQKERYGDQLNYFFDIPPEAFSLYTVKLVLQPLVENAIYHGIKECDHPGEITVSVKLEENKVRLQVQDNGLGILPQKLDVLQRSLHGGMIASADGYGIFNVNERIRLYFGEEYGLELDSVYGKGTIASVTIPRITGRERERYVSDFDCG